MSPVIGGSVSGFLPVSAFVDDTFFVVDRFDDYVVDRVGEQVAQRDLAALWAAEVVANGGTVSAGRQALVSTLIAGLITDGTWQILDRLWLSAEENQTGALVDLVTGTLGTAVSSPTFVSDLGFTGGVGPAYVNLNSQPINGPHYTSGNASFFVWTTSSAQSLGAVLGGIATRDISFWPRYTDDKLYSIFNEAGFYSVANTDGSGFWQESRGLPSSSDVQTYRNGTLFDSRSTAAIALNAYDLLVLQDNGFVYDKNYACVGYGGVSTAAQAANLYARLRTYMTAIGVP